METRNELINDNNFSALTTLPGGFELITLYPGGSYLWYYVLSQDETILFSGKDYKPATLYPSIDGIDSIVGLCGFLSLKPGDTDSDYFKDYTPNQITYTQSNACEDLNLLVFDFENTDSEGHNAATDYFKANYTQDMNAATLAKLKHSDIEYGTVNGYECYIFDNGGNTNDRYTIVLSNGDVYGCNNAPFAPGGFAQFSHNIADMVMFHSYGASWRKHCNVKKIIENTFTDYISDAKKEKNLGLLINPSTLNEDVKDYLRQITSQFERVQFNSHKNHNPTCDIIEGHINSDEFITYCKELNTGKEVMEYYRGSNYNVNSKLRSYSRVYNLEDIPTKYKSMWNELATLYVTKYIKL